MCFRIPLLKGEGAAKRRVRGTEMKRTFKKYLWYPSPGPLARATLSLQERDLPGYVFQFGKRILTHHEGSAHI
jgi:hypothetical protein